MANFLVFDDVAFSPDAIVMIRRYPRDDGSILFKVYLRGVTDPFNLDLQGLEAEKFSKYFQKTGTMDDWLNR
jgi:hypothetical protein